MRTCGLTVGGTSGSNEGILYFGVTQGVHLVVNVGVITCGTSVGGVTLGGTSRRRLNSVIIMTQSSHLVANVGIVTYGTSVGGVTLGGTSGRRLNGVIVMTQSVYLVGHVGVTTLQTSVGGEAVLGTSGRCLNRIIVVAEGIYHVVGVGVITHQTDVGSETVLCTSRRRFDLIIVVTQSRYGLLCNEGLAAYRTVLTFGQTGRRTSRSYRLVNHLGVTGSGDGAILVRVITLGTGVGGVAIRCTSGRRYHTGVAVSRSRVQNRVTYGTGLRCGTGCGSTGSVSLGGC